MRVAARTRQLIADLRVAWRRNDPAQVGPRLTDYPMS